MWLLWIEGLSAVITPIMKRRRHSVTQRIRFFDLFRSRHRNPKLSKRQRLSPSKASATRQLADHQRSAWKPSRSPHVGFCIESANLLQSELCHLCQIRTDVRSSCCMLLDVANYGISCRHQFINTRNLWQDGIWACQVTSAILLERNLLPNETWC